MRGIVSGLWLAMVVTVVATSDARAERVALVVVAGDGAPETKGALAGAMKATARERGLVAVPVEGVVEQAQAAIRSGAMLASRAARWAAVTRAAMGGWKAYLEARFVPALVALERARGEAEGFLDVEGGPAAYADMALRLGAVKLALGRADEAAREFQLAAVTAPSREVSDAEFKPEVVAAVQAARALDAPVVEVAITVNAAGAVVVVDDGQRLPAGGRGGVSVGRHVVVARAPGHLSRGMVIDVDDHQGGVPPDSPAGGGGASPGLRSVRIELPVDRHARALAKGASGFAIGAGVEQVTLLAEGALRYGGTGAVLVVAPVWRRGAPALLGQLCRGEQVRCTSVVEVGYARGGERPAARRLVDLLLAAPLGIPLTVLADDRLVAGEGPPASFGGGGLASPGGAREGGLLRSPWLWAGVSGAALTAAITVLLLSGDDGTDAVGVTGSACDFGGC